MSNNCWAIIPARSGSKGLKDKNIINFRGLPLLVHSINFAKELSFVSRVIVSTDSERYKKIANEYGAEVPFLRGSGASNDESMEEDVLEDIRLRCLRYKITPPDLVLWLRPTHPIRSKDHFEEMYKKYMSSNYSSVLAVTEDDPRLWRSENGLLFNALDPKFWNNKSMIRRQDVPRMFRMYHGELFRFPKSYNCRFLGENCGFVVLPRKCKKDIDELEDL